ncbi:hypothetical protein [Nocardia jejuensis]|uniref:hypothetical protein n=1 Tax=Nocardia jejuensis TaxID=328049 RepID=UPI0008296502|nr:hypothetical protein [Nocardia jejuensis]
MRANPAHSAQLLAALLLAATLSACGATNSAVTTPTTAPVDPTRPPENLRWEPYQGVSLPIGAQDGPKQLATIASGYSHTPQGAALAAINSSTRMSLAPDDTWPTAASQSLMPGPGKDAWVMARAQISITAPAAAATAPHITAYKVVNYTPATTDLVVYATYSDNSITASAQTVTWSADDWRLVLPNPASKLQTIHSIPAIPPDAVNLNPPK